MVLESTRACCIGAQESAIRLRQRHSGWNRSKLFQNGDDGRKSKRFSAISAIWGKGASNLTYVTTGQTVFVRPPARQRGVLALGWIRASRTCLPASMTPARALVIIGSGIFLWSPFLPSHISSL
jgi:hypothetical protein